MYLFGIDVNLMSLGALDFGIIIDGAVIIVEFIAVSLTVKSVQLNNAKKEERQTLMDKITFTGSSKKDWVTAGSKEELVNRFKEALSVIKYHCQNWLKLNIPKALQKFRATIPVEG
jgi:hypothetical protein